MINELNRENGFRQMH